MTPALDSEMVRAAVTRFCELKKDVSFVEGDDNGHARWVLATPDGEVPLRLVDGRVACESEPVKTKILEIIMDMRESEPVESPKTAIKPARHTSAPPATRNAANGRQDESPVDTWRKKQDRTYSVEGGKTVPNAFAASEEANRRRFDVEVDSGRSETVAWGKARAIDPETGRYREAKVSFEWSTFRQRTAWEIVRNMERREPGILQGIDDVTMLPILAPRQYKGQPASLYLHLQILNRWTFADRDAESKAERRAILKLANQEWRDDDEVESERGEERAVREAEP